LKLTNNNYEKIKTGFHHVDYIFNCSKFETKYSGSTAVTVFQIENKLICANIGDSRAVIGVQHKNKETIETIPLSFNHRPDIDTEKERIIKLGGRVEQLKENGESTGPFRVWLKNENLPGIAISRSLGDFVVKNLGVICEPDIIEIDISKEFKFLIIASDGFWDYISYEKMIEIIVYYYKLNDCKKAIEKLIEEATNCWKTEDNYIDDITIVLVFF
jgi:serine/threonine protein phosphatase PrpC